MSNDVVLAMLLESRERRERWGGGKRLVVIKLW